MGDRPEGTVICVLSAEPEFCAKLTLALVIPVVLFTVGGLELVTSVKELLPYAFSKENL